MKAWKQQMKIPQPVAGGGLGGDFGVGNAGQGHHAGAAAGTTAAGAADFGAGGNGCVVDDKMAECLPLDPSHVWCARM